MRGFCRLSCLIGILAATTLFAAGDVSAGTLVINGSGEITFVVADSKVTVRGHYQIENQGDETANAVTPQFELGSWSWLGDSRQMAAGQKETWTLDQTFEVSKLGCQTGDFCAGMNLPLKGAFPLLVTRHYQDLNSYRLSAADVQIVVIGEGLEQAAAKLRFPKIDGQLALDPANRRFRGTVEVRSGNTAPFRAALGLFAPRDLRVITGPQQLAVDPTKSVSAAVELENYRGLVGSSYAVFAILQWEEDGLRQAISFSDFAQVIEEDQTRLYLILGAVCFAGLFVVAGVLLRRRQA